MTIHNSNGQEKEAEVIAQIKIKYYTNSVRYSGVDYVFYTSRDGYEKLGGDMDRVMSYLFPVSYTHLDVHGRYRHEPGRRG